MHLRPALLAQVERVAQTPLSLVSAPGGSGKTTLLRAWRALLEERGLPAAWLTLGPLHADVAFLVEDLVASLREALGDSPDAPDAFGGRLLVELAQLGSPRPAVLGALLARELRRRDASAVLFLDGYQLLGRDSASQQLVDELLRDPPAGLHLVIATRGARPSAAVSLIASGDALEVDAAALSLRSDQIGALLRDLGVDDDGGLAAPLLARTGGWAMGALLAARALAGREVENRERFVARLGEQRDVFTYIASELMGGASEEVVSLLQVAALLGSSEADRLLRVVDRPDGRELLDRSLDQGLLRIDGDVVSLHDLWSEFLLERLRERSPEAWKTLHERVGTALERLGDDEHAIDLFARAGLHEHTARLLERHGDLWVGSGKRDAVASILGRLPEDVRERPALVALQGILLSGQEPDRAIEHLKRAVRTYREVGNLRAEMTTMHELAILAMNVNRPSEIQPEMRRFVSLRRLATEPAVRGLLLLGVGHSFYMTGRYQRALRMLRRARAWDHHPRELGGIALVSNNVLVHQGEWQQARENLDQALADPRGLLHGSSYSVLRLLRAWLGGWSRDDLDDSIEQVEESAQTFHDVRQPMNEALAIHVLARLHAMSGRHETALEQYDRAIAIAQGIAHTEIEAGVRALRAQLRRRLGDVTGAVDESRQGLALFERAFPQGRVWGSSPFWLVPNAAACWILAEAGAAEEARDFAKGQRRRLDAAGLPMVQHANCLLLARVAHRCGDADEVRRLLERGWAAAAKVDLRQPSPDLDEEVLRWGAEQARARGIEPAYLSGLRAAFGIAPEPAARIRSLGGLRVSRQGKALRDRAWRGATQRRLFQRLLAAEGRPLSRERLATDLWPEHPPKKAANSLRVALSRLRDALEPGRADGEPILALDGDSIALRPEALRAWDVNRFRETSAESRLQLERGQLAEAAASARRAFEIYGGAFLPDCYDDWALSLRRELEEHLLRFGLDLVRALLENAHAAEAAELAALLVQRAPADEAAWTLRARAELENGDAGACLRSVQRATEVLHAELDVEPGAELRALADRARRGREAS